MTALASLVSLLDSKNLILSILVSTLRHFYFLALVLY